MILIKRYWSKQRGEINIYEYEDRVLSLKKKEKALRKDN
jgi:hypothetical protein